MADESEAREFSVATVLEEHQVRQHLPSTGLRWEALDAGEHGDHPRSRCQVSVCGLARASWGFRVRASQEEWVGLQRWLRSIAPPYGT